MGTVAVGALLGYVSVFIDEWPLVLHMAACAECFRCDPFEVVLMGRNMRVVAVGAGHFVLWDRVMGKLRELHADLGVAACAEFFLVMTADFLLGPLVEFVAVEAADIVECVHAGVPTGEVRCRRRRVTFQAGHGLRLGWKFLERQQRLEISGLLLRSKFHSFTAGAVTRFAVDQRQAGVL